MNFLDAFIKTLLKMYVNIKLFFNLLLIILFMRCTVIFGVSIENFNFEFNDIMLVLNPSINKIDFC